MTKVQAPTSETKPTKYFNCRPTPYPFSPVANPYYIDVLAKEEPENGKGRASKGPLFGKRG
jgi:hypothetical protein